MKPEDRHSWFKKLDDRLYAWEQRHPVLTWLLAVGLALAFVGALWALGLLR
jgi:hypothetical protein